MEPRVYLVGAGPGHPGLITVRAVECLAKADLVLYDKLVPQRLLDYAPAGAEKVCITELADTHVERVPQVNKHLIEEARRGKCVVRLKGGDPFVFGRGGEEAEALREAGIPFEVVPGITAGLAAAVCAGIPLTDRSCASAVALVTGHENPSKPTSALDWQVLARFPGTLLIYMGVSHLPHIAHALLDQGKDPQTPTVAIQWATTGLQQTVAAPLADLAAAVQRAGLSAPAILVIGSVAALRPRLAWFEKRPLFGKRVLVTRPRHQAEPLRHRLEELGALTELLPVVDIRDPPDWAPVDAAINRLSEYHWLVFTSVNGVNFFLRRMRLRGKDLRALGTLRLAVIGPSTAAALRGFFLEPDLMPQRFNSESLAAALKTQAAGQKILLARADRGRDVLRRELAAVADLHQVAAYSQVDCVDDTSPAFDCLRRGEIDFVPLTSSNIAKAFIRALDETCRRRIEEGQTKLISISPVTSAEIRALGLPVAAEAKEETDKGLIEAILQL